MNSKYTNLLIHETSPYLLQHAHNPVEWHPWNDETLAKARRENKLLLISIGYAACHWCHVMEHECFEDELVASVMNEHFICIKVDREERPDVDQIYMHAAHLITGRGGWPLNAFALPDGKPFYAGTYFPKDNWLYVMEQITQLRDNQMDKLQNTAQQITQGIRQIDTMTVPENSGKLQPADFDLIFDKLVDHLDFEKGGEKKAPKFPMPVFWDYLLFYSHKSQQKEALSALEITLKQMAAGGIYDQIGGGFARYSTDEKWFAPHFEKMLYDNAQLVSLYAHAYQHSPNELYKQVIAETLEFVNRELSHPNGGFYSSLDADSEGVEGKYYIWKYEDLKSVLGKDADDFADHFHITPEGNWEHGSSILYYLPTTYVLDKKFTESKRKLLEAREKRIHPGLDDKILTSWNALMLKAYLDAYCALHEDEYLQKALGNAHFIINHMLQPDGSLLRNHKNGVSNIKALFDDYALTIQAFIKLYQVTFDEKYLMIAETLTTYVSLYFSDEKGILFYYTHLDENQLISRGIERNDNVIPASNSVMAGNLYLLGHLKGNKTYISRSEKMVNMVMEELQENIYYYAGWGKVALLHTYGLSEIAITGESPESFRKVIESKYLPDALICGTNKVSELPLLTDKKISKQNLVYLCRNKTCGLPYSSLDEFLSDNILNDESSN